MKKNGFYLSYNDKYLKIDRLYPFYTENRHKTVPNAKNLKVNWKVDYATAIKLKLI